MGTKRATKEDVQARSKSAQCRQSGAEGQVFSARQDGHRRGRRCARVVPLQLGGVACGWEVRRQALINGGHAGEWRSSRSIVERGLQQDAKVPAVAAMPRCGRARKGSSECAQQFAAGQPSQSRRAAKPCVAIGCRAPRSARGTGAAQVPPSPAQATAAMRACFRELPMPALEASRAQEVPPPRLADVGARCGRRNVRLVSALVVHALPRGEHGGGRFGRRARWARVAASPTCEGTAGPSCPVLRKRVPQALQSMGLSCGPRRHCGLSLQGGGGRGEKATAAHVHGQHLHHKPIPRHRTAFLPDSAVMALNSAPMLLRILGK